MYMNNKLYDTLKWTAQYLLPGLATLYFALSGVWGFPYTEEIVGTIVALDVFLGAALGISNMQYKQAQYVAGDAGSSPMTVNKTEGSSFLAISGNTYEVLKWVTLILLPALGTLYLTVSKFWGFPYGQEIVGTIAAVTAFVGLLLGISSAQLKRSV